MLNLKNLKEDFQKMPKTMKGLMSVLLLICLLSLIFSVSGCYGPSKEYVIKNADRAQKHFPRYKALIDSASPEQLSEVLKKPVVKKAKPEQLKRIKKSLKMEIDGWGELIKTEKELLEKQKEEK